MWILQKFLYGHSREVTIPQITVLMICDYWPPKARTRTSRENRHLLLICNLENFCRDGNSEVSYCSPPCCPARELRKGCWPWSQTQRAPPPQLYIKLKSLSLSSPKKSFIFLLVRWSFRREGCQFFAKYTRKVEMYIVVPSQQNSGNVGTDSEW